MADVYLQSSVINIKVKGTVGFPRHLGELLGSQRLTMSIGTLRSLVVGLFFGLCKCSEVDDTR